MTLENIIQICVSSFFGAGLIVGIFIYYVRRSIDKILVRREKEEEHKKELRKRRKEIDEDMWHAVGRLVFWLNKAIVTGTHNGDLSAAMQAFTDAEMKRKVLDRDIISDCEE